MGTEIGLSAVLTTGASAHIPPTTTICFKLATGRPPYRPAASPTQSLITITTRSSISCHTVSACRPDKAKIENLRSALMTVTFTF